MKVPRNPYSFGKTLQNRCISGKCSCRLTNFQAHFLAVNRTFCYGIDINIDETDLGLQKFHVRDEEQRRKEDMILADKIILLRKKNGWSQEQLAEQLAISRQSVSKWESGTSIPDLDKIIKLSSLFGVSTDYLLKDEVEEIEYVDGTEEEACSGQDMIKNVSLEEANEFMELSERLAKHFALAVFACIISPVCLILLGGLSEYGNLGITEDLAGGIGTSVLLVLIVLAVGSFIWNGMKISKYEYLEKEIISLQYGVKGIVEKKKEDFAPKYRLCVMMGVIVCILAVLPLILAGGFGLGDFIYVCLTGVLLFLVACGVFLLVWSGCIQESYEKLLQEGEYSREKKKIKKRTAFFTGIYWCIVTAVFLAVILPEHSWEKGWVIWPIAGVLYAALRSIVNLIAKERERKAERTDIIK